MVLVAHSYTNRGAGWKGLRTPDFGANIGPREMFQNKISRSVNLPLFLLNDHVLKLPSKYVCLCIASSNALSLDHRSCCLWCALNAETRNLSKPWKWVFMRVCPSCPPRLWELHERGGGKDPIARVWEGCYKLLSLGHGKAVILKSSQQYILNYKRISF